MSQPLLRTDEEIVAIYHRHVDTVYRVCYSFLKNPSDTEDAVQSTFVQLMTHPVAFRDEKHERAWLIVTASNLCKNTLKHWWRRREDLDACVQLPADTRDEDRQVLEAVFALPDRYKTAIYLYYFEGYQAQEIAQMLGKPSSTIRNYLTQGRRLLRKELGGDLYEE